MHFPTGWIEANLPGLTQLQRNGLTFKNAFTNACMCSPARTTLLSGYMPAQHGVRYTLEQEMPSTNYPQVEMPTPDQMPNIATVMSAAGYNVVYKGKLHVNKPARSDYVWQPSDAGKYGFTRWNCPDAGANQSLSEAGGAPASNDERYITHKENMEGGQEGVLQFIEDAAKSNQPFFLVVSLDNAHDILSYPQPFTNSYDDTAMLHGSFDLPETAYENLTYPNKPSAQKNSHRVFHFSGSLDTPEKKLAYLYSYGNLMKKSDAYLVQVLDALTAGGLLDETIIIRTSDHGELGLAHGGGIRQKNFNFNFYEEALRVPLIYSNPVLFPNAVESEALVSHVDFVPTLASLFGAPPSVMKPNWPGRDYSPILVNTGITNIQEYVMFTYDDFQAGQSQGPYVKQPNHIVAIREERYKLAKYYDPGAEISSVLPQYEMYDLENDPLEKVNLAGPDCQRTLAQEREFSRLRKRLLEAVKTRLAPIPLRRPIQLSAKTKTQNKDGNAFLDVGTITGTPAGQGSIALTYNIKPAKRTGTARILINTSIGIIHGQASIKFTIGERNISYVGTAQFFSGTGAFREMKASGLRYADTNSLNGANGRVTITGNAFF